MPKITRALQKIFGSTAGGTEIGQFGSLAAGTPTYTTNPVTIQQLSNFLQGWYGAVISGASPAIEDMNALFYLITYQLAYVMQQGVPEWNASTEYYIGSLASDGAGKFYLSLTDTNLNNALTNATHWRPMFQSPLSGLQLTISSNTVLPSGITGNVYLVDTTSGTVRIDLPVAPVAPTVITIKDAGGAVGTNPLTIRPTAGVQLEGVAGDYVIYAPYWEGTIYYDGTKYWFV